MALIWHLIEASSEQSVRRLLSSALPCLDICGLLNWRLCVTATAIIYPNGLYRRLLAFQMGGRCKGDATRQWVRCTWALLRGVAFIGIGQDLLFRHFCTCHLVLAIDGSPGANLLTAFLSWRDWRRIVSLPSRWHLHVRAIIKMKCLIKWHRQWATLKAASLRIGARDWRLTSIGTSSSLLLPCFVLSRSFLFIAFNIAMTADFS